MTVAEICKHLGIAKSTFYKYLTENKKMAISDKELKNQNSSKLKHY
jgi:hypothetical protein